MPSKRWSELTSGGSILASDVGALARGGQNYKFTFADVRTLVVPSWDAEIVRSADKDITSNTVLENDGVLNFAVVAGGVYRFELLLVYSEPANSGVPDIGVGFALSAGAFDSFSSVYERMGIDTGGSAVQGIFGIATGTSFGAAAAVKLGTLRGQFTCTADALFHFQWAQVSSSGNLVRVHAESRLRHQRVK